MILLVLAAAAATVQSGKLNTYKDWIVGCDNTRVCQANALAPEDGGDDNYLMLEIKRGGLPGDAATLSVPLPDGTAIGSHLSLKVDGAAVAAFTTRSKDEASLPLTGRLLAALGNGNKATLSGAGGDLGEASLAGAAATMRYIDDQQRRVGTVGALKATGARPDASIPAPPPVPVIDTPPPSPRPPRTLSVAEATRLIGPDNATCDYADVKVEPHAYRLDAAHSLVLVEHPCGNGAYNYFTSVYVLDETGPPRDAHFDLPPSMDEPSSDGTGDLTNGDWDPKARQLISYEKGRGLGDCGSAESYVWDGARFRLVEQDQMGECRGSTDFIRTWTARASR